MKVILEPEVRRISYMVFEPHPVYELPEHDNANENIIAFGGKVCYDSYGRDGRSVAEHVQALTQQQHFSVLEHSVMGLFIAGISRGCSHELVRHRVGFSYSQRSTRYTAEDDAAIVLDDYYADIYRRMEGPAFHTETTESERDSLHHFIESSKRSLEDYRKAVSGLGGMSEDARVQQGIPTNKVAYRKWCRGKARQLLPHALETRLVMTGNLLAWRNLLLKRTSRGAEPEMRRLAAKIAELVYAQAPNAFTDIKIGSYAGFPEWTV